MDTFVLDSVGQKELSCRHFCEDVPMEDEKRHLVLIEEREASFQECDPQLRMTRPPLNTLIIRRDCTLHNFS